jgi:predicted GNAT family acetyltransferase
MSLEVRNDAAGGRFVAQVDGHEAVILYVKSGDSYDLQHTRVPEELRGHHVGEELVRGTLDLIRKEGATFVPTCPFVQAFLKRHPEHREGAGGPRTSQS